MMEQGEKRKGSLSINSENIFPILKKWLYQDHDIFFRELVSNGCDAVTKLKKLALIGEFEEGKDEKYRITVRVDAEKKTISFEDNGIGMTMEEVDSYINQVAFSGAVDFLEKYKDKANEDQIIGHFGLGFYSAFMVADRVCIDSLSYEKDAKPVHWESAGGMEYEMYEGGRTQRGTLVTLSINEEELKYCNLYQAEEVLKKYCSFMPVEIYLKDAKKDAEAAAKPEGEKEEEKPVNDIHPLWNENPSKVSEEQYKDFYRKVFHEFREPLFQIHLNMDYPFNLKGILYFPAVKNRYEEMEGVIKLYSNQVFIADNIKEVIPEYLMLLKGVIDCPDLPLNVSRSALQNDGFVKKISDYITKKVSDKLSGMFRTDRENYEKYWDDICPFIKYGCIRDEKFGDRMKDAILFKNMDGRYLSLEEVMKAAQPGRETEALPADGAEAAPGETAAGEAAASEAAAGEPDAGRETTVCYITDRKEQSQYMRMFREAGLDAYLMELVIDGPFISFLEQKHEGLRFVRIDSDLSEALAEHKEPKEAEQKRQENLMQLFRRVLKKDKLDVQIRRLKDRSVASLMTMNEEGRRMQEMMKMYAAYGMGPAGMEDEQTLVLNSENKLVKRLLRLKADEKPDKTEAMIIEQLYDLALLSRGGLDEERMAAFIKRSQELMLKIEAKDEVK